MSIPLAAPTVFISYTHDSRNHDRRVLELSNKLRSCGFDADIDQYHVNESWPSWMEKKIANSDFVLVICTATYFRRWDNDELPGKGLGAQWESRLTRQLVYESPKRNDKFVPVVFEKLDLAYIPVPLRDVTRVVLEEGFQTLTNRLNNIPAAEKPPIRTSLMPIAIARGFFAHEDPSGNLHGGSEELISNIFPVTTPAKIHTAKIVRGKRARGFHELVRETWVALGETGPPKVAYFVENGKVYSFDPFKGEPWDELVRRRRLRLEEGIRAADWAESRLPADTNRFIKLLNQTLLQHCAKTESPYSLIYSKSMDCYLFAAKDGVMLGSLAVPALKSNASRMVFKAIPDKLSQIQGAIQHWQHEAFRFRWNRFGGKWHLVITPFWAFTADGVCSPSRFQKTSSANMRKPEKNRAVLGHVLFWRSVLCRGPDLVREPPTLNINAPVRLQASPSIRDVDWFKVARDDERTDLESDQSQQLLL